LYSFSEVQMTYRNSSANKGIYNSKQLSYLTPWAVHSLLGLDLIGTNAPTFIEQPRFEFSFGLGERNVSVYVHKNYVNYDGNWYKTRDGKSPFEIIERDWLAVLKN
jgi:hypothetical protein